MNVQLIIFQLAGTLSVANRAYVLETGNVIAEKDSAGLLGDPELLNAYLGG